MILISWIFKLIMNNFTLQQQGANLAAPYILCRLACWDLIAPVDPLVIHFRGHNLERLALCKRCLVVFNIAANYDTVNRLHQFAKSHCPVHISYGASLLLSVPFETGHVSHRLQNAVQVPCFH